MSAALTLTPKMKMKSMAVLVAALAIAIGCVETVNGFTTMSPASSFCGRKPSASFMESQNLIKCQGLPSELLSDAAAEAAQVATTNAASSELTTFFLKTLISSGVPAVCTIIVIIIGAIAFRKSSSSKRSPSNPFNDASNNPAAMLYDDLYGDQEQQDVPPFLKFLKGGSSDGGPPGSSVKNKNVGVPKQTFLSLTNLNKKYDSMQYSITAATQSKATAAAQFRQNAFGKALQKALTLDADNINGSGDDGGIATLQPYQQTQLLEWEATLLKDGAKLVQQLTDQQTQLAEITIDLEMQVMGIDSVYQLDPENVTDSNATAVNSTSTTASTTSTTTASKSSKSHDKKTASELKKEVTRLQKDIQKFEMDALKRLLQIVGPASAAAVRAAWLGNIAVRGTGSILQDLQQRPLEALLSPEGKRRVLYVARFPGDTSASQVETLREEVTAIVRNANPDDEVLIVLQTGGGTVTGYGLAGAQLQRIKKAGLKLTIAVEQVAASGGYLMCCVADRIVASPFAVLGSIGVITDIPNVYERLRTEGIEFQTVTAGEYKRTLTPTKKVTKQDFEKTKADVEDILKLFSSWVATNRPQLDIKKVATGETWFGEDALAMNLCDEILPVDDILVDYVDRGFDVFEIEYSPPEDSPLGSLLPSPLGSASSISQETGIVGSGVRWLVRTVANEVRAELGVSDAMKYDRPLTEKYMARNDDADRIKTQA